MRILSVCVLLVTWQYAIAKDWVGDAEDAFQLADNKMKYIMNHLSAVTRQSMLQQFFAEQRVRSEGQSGLKLVRQRRAGTKNYFTESHTGYSAASIHDHANNIRTVGMGEFTAVLNGIEFRTRHNDYRLYMPHETSSKYHATQEVPFPDVPPEVLTKGPVDKQVEEMREWFKAWRDQNSTVRDYRKYFKPILCYLEGAWTTSGSKIDEPFSSDRHFVDATSWMELHEKVRFVANTGTKSLNENLSFLPTKIMRLINDTYPDFAQWNYRILCHPLKRDIPLNRLRVVDDLSSRMMTGRDIHRHEHSRAARFQLNSKDEEKFYDRPHGRGLLDEIMEEIPGKDNYQGQLYDEGLDTKAYDENGKEKDVSRYHRWYSVKKKDAFGTTGMHRGYSDDFMFAAMTTQPKVADVNLKKCLKKWLPSTCKNLVQRWSYAIPLELIYLTPLNKWNPYKLKYHGKHSKETFKIAQSNGRNGVCTKGKEFNGTTSKLYYITPNEFYSGGFSRGSTADTTRGKVCVLDKNGVSREVRSAGVHVFLPNIKDVGTLRQRYPIFPVHGEGSSVWKELNALREIIMDKERWSHMLSSVSGTTKSVDTEISMGMSALPQKTTEHTHDVELTAAEVSQLKGGRQLTKTTSLANGHQHKLEIRWDAKKKNFLYVKCDGRRTCWDRHQKYFVNVDNMM